MDVNKLTEYKREHGVLMKQSDLDPVRGFRFEDDMLLGIRAKIEKNCVPLSSLVKTNLGIQTSYNEAFLISEDVLLSMGLNGVEKSLVHPCLTGKNLSKRGIVGSKDYIIAIPKGWTDENRGDNSPEDFVKSEIPNIMKHFYSLDVNSLDHVYNRSGQGDYWWELSKSPKSLEIFNKRNIVWARISADSRFSFSSPGDYCLNSLYMLVGDGIDHVVPIMNSSIVECIFKSYYSVQRIGGTHYSAGGAVLSMRIPVLSEEDKEGLMSNCSEALIQRIYGLTDKEVEYLLKNKKGG